MGITVYLNLEHKEAVEGNSGWGGMVETWFILPLGKPFHPLEARKQQNISRFSYYCKFHHPSRNSASCTMPPQSKKTDKILAHLGREECDRMAYVQILGLAPFSKTARPLLEKEWKQETNKRCFCCFDVLWDLTLGKSIGLTGVVAFCVEAPLNIQNQIFPGGWRGRIINEMSKFEGMKPSFPGWKPQRQKWKLYD